jgi:hypothetical protein
LLPPLDGKKKSQELLKEKVSTNEQENALAFIEEEFGKETARIAFLIGERVL